MTSPIKLHDLENLGRLRDELRLQAHLFGAELKDRWQDAEKRWEQLQIEARSISTAVSHSREELGAAASLAASTLHDAYVDMRRRLKELKDL